MGIWSELPRFEWRGPTPNCGDGDRYPNEGDDRMREQRGLVEHTAVGTYEGTISWCRNPISGVSAHFVVAKDGRIAQVVDTDIAAWTQRLGNGHWGSVENEGDPSTPLTPAQIEANAHIFARYHTVYGVPLQLATAPSGRGLGHHSMGAENGIEWGHDQCPGVLIKAQKPLIVARAIAIVNGDPLPEEIHMLMVNYKDEYQVYLTDGLRGRLLPDQGAVRKQLRDAGVRQLLLDPAAIPAGFTKDSWLRAFTGPVDQELGGAGATEAEIRAIAADEIQDRLVE